MESQRENRKNAIENKVARPPVVVVMGHIDHGKSTLLDYIRKTNVVEKEVGGITQHIAAYEVEIPTGKITFLDTPGHEAFSKIRARGAKVADIAILLVSAEDGVKPQTVEAYRTIEETKTPFVVAINKIDKPGANLEKTKAELAECGVYLEDYGGKIPYAGISAKTGEGVDHLLELILILAELDGLAGNPEAMASGYVLEANLDPRRGIQATLVIKNGTLRSGARIAAEGGVSPARIIENFQRQPVRAATFSSPVSVVGWSALPRVGAEFRSFEKKSEAEEFAIISQSSPVATLKKEEKEILIVPVVVKADTVGSLEAVEKEVEKIKFENAEFRIQSSGVGGVSEGDAKSAPEGAILISFHVKTDRSAAEVALKRGLTLAPFDIIYKMSEWLTEELGKRRPAVGAKAMTGRAKILKTFSRTKDKQVIGGKVESGKITADATVKILRRDFEIGLGKILGLQKNRDKISTVEEGSEFGMLLESKTEIVPGDTVESWYDRSI